MAATQRALVLAIILTSAGLKIGLSAPSARQRGPAQTSNAQVERGRYLAEEVARCSECHTPRNAQGNLERDQWLQGAQTWISPVKPDPNWAERAPALAGLPSYTDAQAERILEQGIGPDGAAIRPPMHTYHLAPDDARAIVAYLRSLPRGPGE
jgi:mono/diheme cytochrome c family protein